MNGVSYGLKFALMYWHEIVEGEEKVKISRIDCVRASLRSLEGYREGNHVVRFTFRETGMEVRMSAPA